MQGQRFQERGPSSAGDGRAGPKTRAPGPGSESLFRLTSCVSLTPPPKMLRKFPPNAYAGWVGRFPGRARRAQSGGRLLRSRSLRRLPSGRRSSASSRHSVAPGGASPTTSASLPVPAPSLAGQPRAGGVLLSPLLRAPPHQLSRRDRSGNLPPLSPPPAPSLRPSSASHWNQFLGGTWGSAARGGQPFGAGLRGSDGAM